MVKLNRNLLIKLKESHLSVLLLGPRQTGKSTLLKEFPVDLRINLADEEEYLKFAKNPGELRQRISASLIAPVVFIDEVQRLPSLLNTIQVLIDDDPKIKFFLTGSSARRLRRGQANLLPGRILSYSLGPLVFSEIGDTFSSQNALSTGTLPGIYTTPDASLRQRVLRSYAATYLKEEIQADALTRNLEGFARFLYVAAASAAQFLDVAKLSQEAGVSYQSTKRYFEILEDTLIVHRVNAFARSERRRLTQHPRYFFFDNGVLNGLLENFTVSDDRKGMLFENLLFSQIYFSAMSFDLPIRVSSYRTEAGAEVDFIVELNGKTWAIEAKSSDSISSPKTSGLRSFAAFYKKPCELVICYTGSDDKKVDDVWILPLSSLLTRMFAT